jgi:hypothetical protein
MADDITSTSLSILETCGICCLGIVAIMLVASGLLYIFDWLDRKGMIPD